MIICIDYDDTYTRDPDYWMLVIEAALVKGHEVICCTMRYPEEAEDMEVKFRSRICPIYFTSRKAKKPYLAIRGINPDVWIDDSPHWILNDASS